MAGMGAQSSPKLGSISTRVAVETLKEIEQIQFEDY